MIELQGEISPQDFDIPEPPLEPDKGVIELQGDMSPQNFEEHKKKKEHYKECAVAGWKKLLNLLSQI